MKYNGFITGSVLGLIAVAMAAGLVGSISVYETKKISRINDEFELATGFTNISNIRSQIGALAPQPSAIQVQGVGNVQQTKSFIGGTGCKDSSALNYNPRAFIHKSSLCQFTTTNKTTGNTIETNQFIRTQPRKIVETTTKRTVTLNAATPTPFNTSTLPDGHAFKPTITPGIERTYTETTVTPAIAPPDPTRIKRNPNTVILDHASTTENPAANITIQNNLKKYQTINGGVTTVVTKKTVVSNPYIPDNVIDPLPEISFANKKVSKVEKDSMLDSVSLITANLDIFATEDQPGVLQTLIKIIGLIDKLEAEE